MKEKIKRKTDIRLRKLVAMLNKTKSPAWKKIAQELLAPTRKRCAVNIEKLNKYAKKDEIIVVPGKVLGSGEIEKPVFIASYSITAEARKKLGNKFMEIEQAVKENPKGKLLRIIK
ncbi:50S ribosomal protein L18e [archaeon]|nr:50S ribosomal protein L18e [archaeon]